jgi:hypothetical protein
MMEATKSAVEVCTSTVVRVKIEHTGPWGTQTMTLSSLRKTICVPAAEDMPKHESDHDCLLSAGAFCSVQKAGKTTL